MAFEAATLAVASILHLGGWVHGHAKSFSSGGAGTAEAVLCVVLAWGAFAVLRSTKRWRSVALATTGFTIVGFLYGLSITTSGGDAPDIAYHVTLLVLLIATFVVLLRARRPGTPDGERPRPSDRRVRAGS